MKALITLLLACFAISLTANAQENKTVKEETTVKRVVTKEGSKVTVKEVEDVQTEEGAVIVGDEETEDKFFKEDTRVKDAQNVIRDEEAIDAANEAEIAAMKKKQEEELQRSIERAKAKAEAERKALEEQEKARQKALEENRKRLEKRGKGMVKLQKNKKKKGGN